jgi:hypothetical protein
MSEGQGIMNVLRSLVGRIPQIKLAAPIKHWRTSPRSSG